MAITICPVTPGFVCEIGDVNLSQPLTPGDLRDIEKVFADYAVVIFPGQTLTAQQHIAFAENFGPIEPTIAVYSDAQKRRIGAELADVSNLSPDNKVWDKASRMRMFQLGNRLWHTDSSFLRTPARASLLYARAIAPLGGHTEFADGRAAYDALPDAMKARIEGLVVEHSIFHSRAKLGFTEFTDEERAAMPPVPQVLVRTIPQSGRKALYLASHAGRILGMDGDEGRALLEELTAHATSRQFVYTHRWRLHDLVMWDNRCTMHRGTDFEDLRWKRDMQRATVSDVGNSVDLAASRVEA